ncbi:3-keto-disaccharide hydrolase [Persicirhabdus sediminis]|uniref:DUF1080 domain-containing protein n=1 Tax=Persicirhabdus sediminis TaxID=454144 RepID=A0A8J7MCW7_9BACT|nr:DUF1080 domain-containing protein [Persicirhabdus sediminis]MBK1789874.1 DUF1080 domain-containing protein [Persicirhabdus sediminis]
MKKLFKKSVLLFSLLGTLSLSADNVVVEDGFVALFNGKDFSGWHGNGEGYSIEGGVLSCDGKKNLMTEKEYKNFVLRFDFIVPAKGNNGIALRAPLKVNPKNMMEIQILDNPAYQEKKLKPYQYHGSAYGWAGAKQGYLKPTGEWNSQEIAVNGDDLKVTLNGTVILDVNLAEIKPTLEPKHKSVWNENGRLGLLGHGAGVKFRNLRIQELPAN